MKKTIDTKIVNDLKALTKNKASSSSKTPTAASIFFKATMLSILFVVVMLVFTVIGVGFWGLNKVNNFTKLADTSISELKTMYEAGSNMEVTQTNNKKNILILGLDSLESRPGSPALSDTIMLLSIDIKSGQVSTISLPRDLWSFEYKTRINALYFYGQEKYPTKPERFAQETIQDLTGVEIHHTIILSIDSVAEIIDILGGIEVDVQQGFTDNEFPKSGVDVSVVTDPDELYETITFEEGLQKMNGERVLQFIRSRKSGDDQGDDIARSSRQQLIINSLIQKAKNFEVIKDEKMLAKLYRYYQENFSKQFSIEEGIATMKSLLPIRSDISFNSNSISIYPKDKLGVITNPPTYKYQGEWVYEIRDRANFKNEIIEKLNL